MLVDYARSRWPLAALGGAASIGSYAIALWAMTRAPVASVAALRETSVLFATVLGTVMLKEAFGLQRAFGAAVIVAGVMALRLG
jgi:drug/metabolite transporter (DMT)-like permease